MLDVLHTRTLDRVLSAYRYVFERTSLHLVEDLSVSILQKYGGLRRAPDVKGKLFPDRCVKDTATRGIQSSMGV